jgi:nanoRNase/pAp phosphatase (c-di-AMP/oligoRNAs hydrolase)
MDSKEFLKVLKGLDGRTAISFHSRADPDAVASALALAPLVSRCVVRSPDEVDSSAKNLLSTLGYGLKEFSSPKEIQSFENLIFVDVSNLDLLGPLAGEIPKFRGKILVVDHHLHGKRMKCDYSLFQRDKTSCAEVVLDLWQQGGKKPSAALAQLILAAVVADSADLRSANKQTFEAIAYLLDISKTTYQQARHLVIRPPDVSEKLAMLKAVAGATIQRTNSGFVIASTQSNAFEHACSQALVASGADIAFTANIQKGRISGVRRETIAPTVSVGKILEEAGKKFGGSGGGHQNAGGARGDPSKTAQALAECLQLAEKELEGKSSRRTKELS